MPGSSIFVVINMNTWFIGFKDWSVRGMWNSLQVQGKVILEHCEQRLMGHSDESLGDQKAKGQANSGGPAPEFSGSTSPGVILGKILTSFCLCPDLNSDQTSTMSWDVLLLSVCARIIWNTQEEKQNHPSSVESGDKTWEGC